MATKTKDEKYIETVGRRKTAIARVRITPALALSFQSTTKRQAKYFFTEALHAAALEPFLKVSLPTAFAITVVV
jgi:ribosomal protein S9